MKKVLALMVA
ncbi:acid shock repeat family protein, partial [Yersinia pestis PY-12]